MRRAACGLPAGRILDAKCRALPSRTGSTPTLPVESQPASALAALLVVAGTLPTPGWSVIGFDNPGSTTAGCALRLSTPSSRLGLKLAERLSRKRRSPHRPGVAAHAIAIAWEESDEHKVQRSSPVSDRCGHRRASLRPVRRPAVPGTAHLSGPYGDRRPQVLRVSQAGTETGGPRYCASRRWLDTADLPTDSGEAQPCGGTAHCCRSRLRARARRFQPRGQPSWSRPPAMRPLKSLRRSSFLPA